jgi:hypothetical protein
LLFYYFKVSNCDYICLISSNCVLVLTTSTGGDPQGPGGRPERPDGATRCAVDHGIAVISFFHFSFGSIFHILTCVAAARAAAEQQALLQQQAMLEQQRMAALTQTVMITPVRIESFLYCRVFYVVFVFFSLLSFARGFVWRWRWSSSLSFFFLLLTC